MIAAESFHQLLLEPEPRDFALRNGERWVWLIADPDNDLQLERWDGAADYELPPEPPRAHVFIDGLRILGYCSRCHVARLDLEQPGASTTCIDSDKWDWLEHERSDLGWETLVVYPTLSSHSHGDNPTATWLLQNGIAPGQPFLVHFDPPEYTKSWTDWGYEYDSDFPNEVVYVQPIPPGEWSAAARWEDWIAAGYNGAERHVIADGWQRLERAARDAERLRVTGERLLLPDR